MRNEEGDRLGSPETIALVALAAALISRRPRPRSTARATSSSRRWPTGRSSRGTTASRPGPRSSATSSTTAPSTCRSASGAATRRRRSASDAAASNPLLDWPQPLTDRPDAAFRRQFSDVGQCFHYMATLDDAQTDALPGTAVPRALATSAVVRCNDLLDGLLRQVVVIGGPATRRSSHGLYEFMHAVGDSFSGSHTERTDDGRIGYLRVWQPIEKLVKLPTERSARIPATAYHKWDDHRDKTYVIEGGEAHCEKRTDQPVRRPLRVPLARGGPGAARARRAPRPRAGPSRRAARGAEGDGHGAGALGRVARLQGEVVRARPPLRGRGVRRAREGGCRRPVDTRSSASTRPGTRRATSSTSPRAACW